MRGCVRFAAKLVYRVPFSWSAIFTRIGGVQYAGRRDVNSEKNLVSRGLQLVLEVCHTVATRS